MIKIEKFIDDLTEKVNKLEHVNHYDMEKNRRVR